MTTRERGSWMLIIAQALSCPVSTGKEKWIKLTGPVTFIYINEVFHYY